MCRKSDFATVLNKFLDKKKTTAEIFIYRIENSFRSIAS